MRVLKGAARACGRFMRQITPSGNTSKITRRSSQVRGRSHVKSPVVCSDDLKIGQGELRHPATALLRTRAYPFSQPLPAIPQPLHEASLVQQDQVKVMFGRMLAMLHNMEELMVDMKDFQLLVRDAANAGIFSLWPFRGSNAACSNIVTMMFYFPDIVHTASLMQRLDDIFPYLELILSTDTASNVSPNNSPPLHETLTLLAEAYDLPDITEETRFGIRKLLSQWCVMRVPTDSCVGMWSSQPEPSRVDKHDIVLWVVGALKAQRRSACDCSPSAALQLVPAKTPVDPANIPQGLYTADDVKAIVETAVQQAEAEKEKAHKMLIKRPNDKMMIRNYVRARTLHYRRDFNTDMLVQKRQRDARQAELDKQQVIDVLPLTSLLASMDDGCSDL